MMNVPLTFFPCCRQIAWATTLVVLLNPVPATAQPPREKLARPTPEQAAWQDCEVGMFIHLGPATWQDREADDQSTPLPKINPEKLDTEQWVSAAEAMGAKYIVFVAKHGGGFCWWQTDTSTYGVKQTPWRGGMGDVMQDLAESCRKRGIKLGVYLSPHDDHHGAGDGGRCKSVEAQTIYNQVYRQQLTELLSRYGEIFEVWFDGSCEIEIGDILNRYCPRAMVFQGPQATIRWVGNEEGIAPYPNWNSLPLARAQSGVATGADGNADGDAWLPNECDARIRDTWFWNAQGAPTLKSVDQLISMYYQSVGRGAVLLLNMTPDTTGLMPEADMRRAAEFGEVVRHRFARSIAETAGNGKVVELVLDEPTRIDHVVTMENILEGERVREYVIEGLVGDRWQELCRGTSIGHKKIDPFSPVEVSQVRMRCLKSAAEPSIRKLAAYAVPAPNHAVPIDQATLDAWSAPYRGWHYHAEPIIPSDLKIPGHETFHSFDVPTVYQLPDQPGKWFMSFIGFDGQGYNSFVAESADLVQWTNPRLAMGFGPPNEFDHGGCVVGAFLYESYDIKAARTLKRRDGNFWTLYGCYPRQGGYELRPGYEGLATSDDGLAWRRAKDTPILAVQDADCGVWEKDCIYQPWLVEHDGRFHNFYNAAHGGTEQLGGATSTNLLDWQRYATNPIVRVRPGGYDSEFCSDGKVFRDGDHWVMFYFGVGQGGAHIMVAFSRDLQHWTSHPDPLYKAGGHPGGLDAQYAHKISLVYNLPNDTFYLYYCACGNKGRCIGLLTSRKLPEYSE